MKKIYYFEEPKKIEKENGIIEMIGNIEHISDVDAIYTENAGVKNLMDIRDELREKSMDIPIYVITSPFRETFLNSIVPGVQVISESCTSAEIISKLENPVRSSKKVRNEFSKKEKLILEEMSYGLCNKEICQSLNISDRTVRRYKTKLLEKTGLLSYEQLGLYALTSSLEN